MANIAGQRQVQIGDEASGWGNNAAPTVELSGIDPSSISIPPSIVTQIVRAARGGIVPGRDTIDVRHEVSGVSLGGHVIYEQIPYFLEMLDEVSPTGSGPYTYPYVSPLASQVTPRPQTLVMGVGNAVFGITSACAASMSFEWSWGEPLMWNAELMGYDVVADAFAALDEAASSSLTYAIASQCTVYIDALAGTLGSTAFSKVLSGNLEINCNRQYLRRSGSLYPAGVYDSPYWDITGTLVLEEDATSAGYADAIIAGATSKLLRIKFTNGEAAADERSLTFDIAALVHVEDLMTDDNDLSTVELSFEPIEEGDWTSAGSGEIDGYFEVAAVNNTSSLY
ncbi:MAG: hypothetical protein GF364_22735 [Candidatus Lokiarchaeota archaeon]|nr:hypothetical protein [Candidatus Lokiarchaeota archaeon]